MACEEERTEVAELLIKHKASITCQNKVSINSHKAPVTCQINKVNTTLNTHTSL